ncbi:1-acylglycerol-3-phosphate O-acyltransferase [Gayadomonas joobiniege]|uniref:1-acylglycerol-3-phosphate O-acyltransferase n=1 Tax=Gayadomonas joobiniege TaxID=1234606 RepID=UPI00036F2F33|nr:1-acylglycerol-3-phosphate O-acyltransferase [Gayadomonas joobiniege]
MLAIFRVFLLGVFVILASIAGIIFCLLRPFHRNNVYWLGQMFGRAAVIIGCKVIIRSNDKAYAARPAVFIANHQNSYDIFTLCRSVLPNTVTIGKKSLKWIPFFGQIYWLGGNILIDRENRRAAMATLKKSRDVLLKRQVSVWMFPEGTRSYGRGLLPFKRGAFQLAAAAKVPVVPVVMSSTDGIKLNRWDNGHIIIELMDPVELTDAQQKNIKIACQDFHALMLAKLNQLDDEVKALNQPQDK